MAQENIPQQGGAQQPAVQRAPQGLDATGTFVSVVKAEENRHCEAMTSMYQAQTRAFGSGLVEFLNGVIEKACASLPKDSLAGTAIGLLKDFNESKLEGRKADLKHMEVEDQIRLTEKQTELERQKNKAKELDIQLAETNKEKAEAEARVSERFGNFSERIRSFEDRLNNTPSTPAAGPALTQPTKKTTKEF